MNRYARLNRLLLLALSIYFLISMLLLWKTHEVHDTVEISKLRSSEQESKVLMNKLDKIEDKVRFRALALPQSKRALHEQD